MRLNCLPYGLELVHQLLVYVETSGGIYDKDVEAFAFSFLFSVQSYLCGVAAVPVRIDRYAYLLAYYLQLVYGSGPVDVAGSQHRLLALFYKIGCKLGRSGGLTCSLKTCKHYGGKAGGAVCEFGAGAAQEPCKLVVYDLYDLLSGCKALKYVFAERFFFYGGDELLNYLVVYVRLKQRKAYLAHCFVYVRLGDDAFSAQLLKGYIKFIA